MAQPAQPEPVIGDGKPVYDEQGQLNDGIVDPEQGDGAPRVDYDVETVEKVYR